MAEDRYRYFRIEAREILEQLGKGALTLEKGGPASDRVPELLRLAHTLKGAARVVQQRGIADRAHAIEEVLSPLRDSIERLSKDHVRAILGSLDEIDLLVRAIDVKPSPAVRQEPARPEALESVRTDLAEVESLLQGLSEMHAQVTSMKRSLVSTERAKALLDVLAEQLTTRPGRGGSSVALQKARSTAEELRGVFDELGRTLTRTVEQIDRELGEAREQTEQLRLVPCRVIFVALERTARDAAEALGKQVELETLGEQIRLDARVLEDIRPGLVQLIRNAVAHGIEERAERVTAGKPSVGRVRVQVLRRGRFVLFRVRDDGRGIDVDAVRRAALEAGVAKSELASLKEDELISLLLRGGISTSESVTEISGRGIGLDIVRQGTLKLHGAISVETKRGKGTTFELRIPLSVAAIETLALELAGERLGIPLDAVRAVVRLLPKEISRSAEGQAIVFEGSLIPFLPLADALRRSGETTAPLQACSAVVVEGASGRAAFGVDGFGGALSTVIRPLPELVPVISTVAGVSLDAEGNPELVLDPDGLVTEARRVHEPRPSPERRALTVLVVDDSLTTRMLEQSILVSAGYDVELASSAEQALTLARHKRFALFLVDVEMPGMDGFGFIEQIRADPTLREIPAILVTSCSSSEHRERGRRVGANGYVVKSEFDQVELLERIRTLVA